MKKFIKLFVLMITVLQITSVLAAENIAGTWQGKLVTAPGSEMTIQFIITQETGGSYSAILNCPDMGSTIKNIKANSVAFSSGSLKLNVAELSGSYEGVLKNGKIDGKWKQEGTSFPLVLATYEKPTLSKKDMDKLLGSWNGKITIPGGSLTVVFRFERTEKGEFVGFTDSPDQGGFGIPVTEMGMSDGILILKISTIQGEYKGKLGENEIAGELKQAGMTMPLTLKKGEYKGPVLTLPKEVMDKLLGEWNGPLTMPTGGSIIVVFRFEMTKNSEFVGFLDSPDQGAKGLPVTEANLSDAKLTLKITSLNGEFKGQLSGDKLVGAFTQAGNSTPLTLNKGAYVAPVYKLSMPKDAMEKLSGKWNGKMPSWDGKSDPSDVVFRFEKAKNGDFKGFVDMPAQGTTGMPVTEANLSEGKLTLKIKAAMPVEFKGQLSGDKLVGEWLTAGAKGISLSLTKEKP